MLRAALPLVLALALVAEAKPPVYRGSQITYSNTVTALSLDRSADPTYNPAYTMSALFRPRLWIRDLFYVQAKLEVARELTQADDTTFADETVVSDLHLATATTFFEGAGFSLGASLDLGFPTSKASRARTMVLGFTPGVSAEWEAKLLAGLSLGVGATVTKYFDRYSTSQRDAPLIPGCRAGDGANGCSELLSTGDRNVNVRLIESFSASLDVLEWLGFELTADLYQDVLYPQDASDPRVSLEPQEPTDTRYTLGWGVELYFEPWKALTVAIGASALNPARAPDTSLYAPFFNRYTSFYLDLRFDMAGMVETFTPAEEIP